MSYQVLARKYRPRNFETLVGQEHVVRALTHALEQQRLHHAYLFTGTRGVGKTTLSRILAKSLNCERGITAKPCGTCDACTAIDAGRFVDYIEMDAASNRGVDEMAQLLEQAVYAPSNARFKVYMIDEVHMLTNHAFNSMLKTLEEPPEHVKFILATTDPQKIPVTVLSRCLQFNLKQMPPGHIISHLDNILGQENIAFETPALRLLAQGAHGSMRDALSLTDQAIAYAAGRVTLEAVQGMLGALDQSYLIRLLDALAVRDGAGLLSVADEMASRSLSYNGALQDMGSLLHRIALAQTVPTALPDDLPERDDILRIATLFDAEEVQLFYQIAVHGRNELGLAPDEYAGFSMTLLRMLAFRPDMYASEEVKHPARTSSVPPTSAFAKPSPIGVAMPSSSPTTRKTGSMSPVLAALEAARNGGSKTSAAATMATSTTMLASARIHSSVPASIPPTWEEEEGQAKVQPAPDVNDTLSQKKTDVYHPVPFLNWDGNWPLLASTLALRGVVQQLAQQSELIACDDSAENITFALRVPIETLLSSGSKDKLAAGLSAHFDKTIEVKAEIGSVTHTAHAQAITQRGARQREAEATVYNDPFVQNIMREFGATIVPGSIHPI
jgi:DNA polymerase III subunit gamma/tau